MGNAVDLVNELGLSKKVFFLGSCLSDESKYYYEYTDGFILPTKFLLSEPVQIESWGFTVNEAMALGKPVLSTTAVGSAYDLIIDEQTGYVAKAGCVDDFTDKLVQFIDALENNTFNAYTIKNHLQATCNYESNLAAYKLMLIKK
jgi:glycosyltransferase involved in cell wall biosynthesis